MNSIVPKLLKACIGLGALTLLTIVAPASANNEGDASAANSGGNPSVREELRSLQRQINELRDHLKRQKLRVTFRDHSVSKTLAPGQTEVVALGCELGEVVISGGFNSNPAEALKVVLSTPFSDSAGRSGWRADFHNPTDATIAADMRVTASCAKGKALPEDPDLP